MMPPAEKASKNLIDIFFGLKRPILSAQAEGLGKEGTKGWRP
jgi:hypothetical protein